MPKDKDKKSTAKSKKGSGKGSGTKLAKSAKKSGLFVFDVPQGEQGSTGLPPLAH